jgi:hypothetical protein
MIMMSYGGCRSSLQLTGTQTSGTPHAPEAETTEARYFGDGPDRG